MGFPLAFDFAQAERGEVGSRPAAVQPERSRRPCPEPLQRTAWNAAV